MKIDDEVVITDLPHNDQLISGFDLFINTFSMDFSLALWSHSRCVPLLGTRREPSSLP